ncbi:phage head closure protein [Acinetobacter ursingii]|uniref:phage head closure protein n=2 Tax=Acinetobacter ursingii TaxID=108980 RepID=UPI00125056AD|nr:phage head closure protein [Acinetobacter ursingii]MCU4496364.1 phage head closure protein [Acinetobacter ursingii]UYF78244.1 phage head closure protein [Acinetobacter ursingii]
MRAGQLRQRIKIQKFNAEGRDGSGMQNGEVWEDYATVWANVDDLSTRDIIADRAAQGTMQARATIRYSPKVASVDTTYRVLFEGKLYRIDGDPTFDTGSRREYMTLNLAEGLKEWG